MWKLRSFCVIGALVHLCTMIVVTCSEEYCTKESCDNVMFDQNSFSFTLKDDHEYSTILLPQQLKSIEFEFQSTRDSKALIWQRYGSITITKEDIGALSCHMITWDVKSNDFNPYDCIPLREDNWYGGSELHYQRWPLDIELELQAFVSEDIVVKKEQFGNVIEPMWLSSSGVSVFVDKNVPLHVSFNSSGSNQMCFMAKYSVIFQRQSPNDFPLLKYHICKGGNLLSSFHSLRSRIIDLPNGIPDVRMIKSPIWSTWAKYKVDIDQTKILQYADDINRYGFPNSQLEIDDMYSTTYGDFNFDLQKFSDPKEMIKQLNEKGFRTSVWVTPFANLDSVAFTEGTDLEYWLTDSSKNVPALVKWWQGIGAVLDPTNPNASIWFNDRLHLMKTTYGIDSFKFDAGEMTFLPFPLHSYQKMMNPNLFTTKYVDTVSSHGNMIEVRCGYKSQKHPIFVRMGDKESRWGYDNGLKTIIPTALTFGLLGYPYVLPDMIGGNGYGEILQKDVILPNRELYIRWLQLTAYLTTMQFSFAPWDYDDEVVQIALKMVNIHQTVVTPKLMAALDDVLKHGYPWIRPMWWIDPDDRETYKIDSQFMVGNDLMVAPVVEYGTGQRDIYLTKGVWKDNLSGLTITGPKWLKSYTVKLDQVATFDLL